MLVMRKIEDPANPLGELVSSQRIALRLHYFALGVYPLGFYGVKPRALLGQKATYDPHSFSTLLDFSIVRCEPAPELFGDVPARVVPDENQHLLARRLELLQAPLEKLGGYGTHGPTVHEPYPRLIELGHIEPIAGDGFRVRVVFGDRLLRMRRKGFPCSLQLFKVGRASRLHQHSSKKPTVQVSGLASATSISRSRRLFFFHTGGRER
jgi:hypothetical protein